MFKNKRLSAKKTLYFLIKNFINFLKILLKMN